MIDNVTEFYEIRVIRRVLTKKDGQDVVNEQNLLDATLPTEQAAAVLRSTADSLGTVAARQQSGLARFLKALNQSVEAEREKAKTEGRPDPWQQMLDSLKGANPTPRAKPTATPKSPRNY